MPGDPNGWTGSDPGRANASPDGRCVAPGKSDPPSGGDASGPWNGIRAGDPVFARRIYFCDV